MRITFERRRSDFERDARVTPFTGSCCCCCCCLHWVGAAVGGVIGMRKGWATAEKSLAAPLPIAGRAALRRGVTLGILAAFGMFVGALGFGFTSTWMTDAAQFYLVVIALAPPFALLPVFAPLLLSAYGTRRKMLAVFRADIAKLPPRDGSDKSMSLYRAKLTPAPKTHASIEQFSVFCRHCWFDLGESMHLATCPECNQEIASPVISGPDYGISVAWRASMTSLGAATLGGLTGYAVMLVIAMFTSLFH